MTPAQTIPLDHAYLCENCRVIGDNAQICPACADSTGLLNLAAVLDREPADISLREPDTCITL